MSGWFRKSSKGGGSSGQQQQQQQQSHAQQREQQPPPQQAKSGQAKPAANDAAGNKSTGKSKSMPAAGGESFLDPAEEKWISEPLSLFIFGASGDLAKKKTYPAIFDLHKVNALAADTLIVGYSRSSITDAKFRERLRPFLLKKGSEAEVDAFLAICIYRAGQYDDAARFAEVCGEARGTHALREGDGATENRAFYFAIPPDQFLNTARTVHDGGMGEAGWNRLILEKPFGHDTESAKEMGKDIAALFDESHLYRIDHYLGKEMVQNVVSLRFGNAFLEPLWNRDHIAAVIISFKEDFGTEGRGGYFDNYGIVRDVMQNHLMQLLSIIAMEPPARVAGTRDGVDYSNFVRDEKVKVLSCIEPWNMDDMVLGQYAASEAGPGYLDDDTVPKGSTQPTYAAVRMFIHNKRWEGVPFIMKAGKALDERKVEVRIQFKDPAGARAMFNTDHIPRNELVLVLQPKEKIYMKMNVKKPGLHTTMLQSELDLTYHERYDTPIPDAYTRLILDVLRGKQATFVRNDELLAAWEIVTPALREIETHGRTPIAYAYGGRGPQEADDLVEASGYRRNAEYAERYKSWEQKRATPGNCD